MAGNDEYPNDRRPSYGNRPSYVRGFRSRPGAPQHDPSMNAPMSEDNRTPQSNWDRMFRNTATNQFGATTNPNYTSSFPNPTAPPSNTPVAQVNNQENQDIAYDEAFGGGTNPFAMQNSHQNLWSNYAPVPPRIPRNTPPLSGGWMTSNAQQRHDILGRYGKNNNTAFNWGSAFNG